MSYCNTSAVETQNFSIGILTALHRYFFRVAYSTYEKRGRQELDIGQSLLARTWSPKTCCAAEFWIVPSWLWPEFRVVSGGIRMSLMLPFTMISWSLGPRKYPYTALQEPSNTRMSVSAATNAMAWIVLESLLRRCSAQVRYISSDGMRISGWLSLSYQVDMW